ncbi:DNA-binding response OmpR family regulator [Bacillus niacini]|uniref:DNA-binding response OmpR family regulator n=1 Tax=Neobacillus niacini TaxID=86668 RepID=A0A852T9M5_9BACI|nr:DNA-binding response OmpR family regulator [Neobacillus niacini]
MSKAILVVDDDKEIAELIEVYLHNRINDRCR